MLPDRNLVNNGQTAIEYIKVDGIWENQSNLAEAEKVVKLVQEVSTEQPDKEIGIVTFNAVQQELIMDILDNLEMTGSFTRPQSLIVKNIEDLFGYKYLASGIEGRKYKK